MRSEVLGLSAIQRESPFIPFRVSLRLGSDRGRSRPTLSSPLCQTHVASLSRGLRGRRAPYRGRGVSVRGTDL